MRVLIVDDHEETRRAMVSILAGASRLRNRRRIATSAPSIVVP